jgi:hypothetical protein
VASTATSGSSRKLCTSSTVMSVRTRRPYRWRLVPCNAMSTADAVGRHCRSGRPAVATASTGTRVAALPHRGVNATLPGGGRTQWGGWFLEAEFRFRAPQRGEPPQASWARGRGVVSSAGLN